MEGLPAQEGESPAAAWSGDSGRVSQSHSSASGPWEDEAADPGGDLPLLRRAAAGLAAGLLPGAGAGAGAGTGARPEVAALDAGLDELLARVDEFVGLLDLLRGDSAAAVREAVPRIQARAAALRRVFGRVDRLEAFVRLVAAGVARLEEQLARAEAELGASPGGALRRLLRSVGAPALFPRAAPAPRYRPPDLFRTDDFFPGAGDEPQG